MFVRFAALLCILVALEKRCFERRTFLRLQRGSAKWKASLSDLLLAIRESYRLANTKVEKTGQLSMDHMYSNRYYVKFFFFPLLFWSNVLKSKIPFKTIEFMRGEEHGEGGGGI